MHVENKDKCQVFLQLSLPFFLKRLSVELAPPRLLERTLGSFKKSYDQNANGSESHQFGKLSGDSGAGTVQL